VFLVSFLHATVVGCVLIHKDELTSIHAGVEAGHQRLDAQSDKIDRLLEAHEQQHDLLRADIEQNTETMEVLASLIRGRYPDARRRSGLQITDAPDTDKLQVGEAEKVRLTPPDRVFHARMDTGATTSSLDARDIEPFEREGNPWVRFKVADPENGSLYEMEQPVIRYVRIIQPAMTERDRRPVVKLQIQLGRIQVIEEFTLVDRRDLRYQVLIGRNILRDLIVVDVAQKFIVPLPEAGKNGNGSP